MKNDRNVKLVRPNGMNPRVWNVLKKVAAELWKEHDNGASVKRNVMISCKEFYEMLLDGEGKLILDNKSLIRFANNGHIKTWSNEVLLEAINLIQNGATESAIEKLELHLMLDKDSVGGRIKLSECYMLTGKNRAALSLLNEAVHIKPESITVYIQRAKLYSALDQDERALNDLNFALLLNPNSFEALKSRAYLRLALNTIELAIEDIKRMESLIPNHLESIMLKGNVYFQERKFPKAYKQFKKVLSIEPHNADALVRLAQIKMEFKVEEKTAVKDLEFARALGHPKAHLLLNRLLSNQTNQNKAA